MHYKALYRNILACHFWNIDSRQRVAIRYMPLSGKRFEHQELYRTFPRLVDGSVWHDDSLSSFEPKTPPGFQVFRSFRNLELLGAPAYCTFTIFAITKDICNLWEDPSPVPPSQLSR